MHFITQPLKRRLTEKCSCYLPHPLPSLPPLTSILPQHTHEPLCLPRVPLRKFPRRDSSHAPPKLAFPPPPCSLLTPG